MDARVSMLAEHLLLIERELRLLGWWQDEAPSAEALASPEPFCVDTLTFEQWLQWIFLPRMKVLLESGAALPSVSGIQAMGEMVYRQQPGIARRLLELLGEFDRLLTRTP
ncbi:YqcC family protein [Pseudomonas mendocina]|uniref:YqcC family protein n=1 Tax=Pseudomonas wenzhouensis TaxID=2906062 RepID=UPI0011C7C0E3|nr:MULTISPECIES: YqcC family protein [Pseudomonas]MDM9653083.1 YqcC family protein [Pseudomonas wenzhouensis]MDV5862705.1 YqcC family protein [Pseudomonas mendocina]TXR35795.1 YqcC family protein [Pseudomonas mendocina]UFQ96848.1 YqcC family protein [Pseudomonas wenzhouensis]